MNNNYKIALLIDCDNVSHQSAEGVLQELAKYGAVNVRHAHGNWNGPQLSGWIEKLHSNAIRPVQQFAYTTGKNATDASMIIDAMDIQRQLSWPVQRQLGWPVDGEPRLSAS
ncbi:MAG: NYN domain-containing protein [Marinobacter sp.]|jgi:hypothetical protein|uniref:NYN domain-containing protein n=1 Tax=Marinobacter salarius TaxID=1420917 RepID=W5YWH6_9GAMM|nr:hypothetical protein AU15_21675 [Marinobacter salarius]